MGHALTRGGGSSSQRRRERARRGSEAPVLVREAGPARRPVSTEVKVRGLRPLRCDTARMTAAGRCGALYAFLLGVCATSVKWFEDGFANNRG